MKVLICANCKDYWVKLDGVNYCGSCGSGCLEPTHESNASMAKNLEKVTIKSKIETLQQALIKVRDHKGCIAVIRKIARDALDEVEK